jgi:hypothetical protein
MPYNVISRDHGEERIKFRGEREGTFHADVVRGGLHKDLWMAIRGLDTPGLAAKVKGDYRVKIPKVFLGRRNIRGDERRGIYIVDERGRKTGLRFSRTISQDFLNSLIKAIRKNKESES